MSVRPFVNWSRTVRSQPARWEAPVEEAEVAAAVRRAARDGLRVRPIGSAHSWSPIAAGDGVMLDLRGMNRVRAVSDDRVTVEAGCTLHDLLEVLARHGRALPIVGSIDAQSIAGLTATGTHGSSLRHGNLSSLVRGMRLVDGRGEVVPLDEADPRLTGGRVHLGALGVLTELTLETTPAFRLEETLERVPFARAVADIQAIARSAEYVKVWWLAPSPDALVFRCSRTTEPGEISPAAWAFDAFQYDWVFPPLLALGGAIPALIPVTNRIIDRVRFRPQRRIGRSDRVLKMPMPPRHRETEAAFPIERAGEAMAWLHDWIGAHRARVDFITEVRFVPADRAWLSPAFGRDTCQLGAYAARSPDTDRFFDAFREAARGWDGRPHWGKELRIEPGDLDRWYPYAARFRDLASVLDPDSRFHNPMLESLLRP